MASWTDSDFWVNDIQNMITSSVARLQSAGQNSYSTVPNRPTPPEVDDISSIELNKTLPESSVDDPAQLNTIEVYDLPSRDIMDLVTDLEERIADPSVFEPLGLFTPTQDIPDLDKFVRTAEFEDFMAERHNTYVWYSQQITDLIAEVNSVLTTGGYGVSDEMQQSLFDQDIERKLQALDDSLLRLNAGLGARGFRLPNSFLAGQRNELLQKHQFDRENQSREIIKLMEEHYRQNVQTAMDAGIKIENFHGDFTNKYDRMFIEMKGFAVEYFGKMLAADIAVFEAGVKQLEGYITKARFEIEAHKVNLESKNQELQKIELDLKVDELNLRRYLGEIDGYAKAYSGDIEVVKARNESIALDNARIISETESQIKAKQFAIELVKADIAMYQANIDKASKAAEALTNKYANEVRMEGAVLASTADTYKAEAANAGASYQALAEAVKGMGQSVAASDGNLVLTTKKG